MSTDIGTGADGYEGWSRAGWHTHVPGAGDMERYVAALGGQPIPALAAAAADRFPDRVAVTVDGEPVTHAELDEGARRGAAGSPARLAAPGDGEPVTHAELDEAARRVAAWLAERVRPGDRVLLAAGA